MKSFLSYLGGKSLLSEKIISLMPEHTCYCEVFAGAAWMLFKKDPSKVEIINNINSDLVTLYRIVKYHLEEFVRYLKWILVSRDEFDHFKIMEPNAMTDIQRAVRFYYLLKTGYASKIVDPCFVISTFRKPAFNLLRIEEELSTAHLRLSAVAIDNKPYAQFISKYDKPHVFFYLDPPYFGMENYYGKNIFQQDDFRILASMLSKISGKFIMSINNHKTIHEIFKDFNHRKVYTRYNVSNKSKRVEELLIMNY